MNVVLSICSLCRIKNHPFGRQKAMLDLGLIETFNGMKAHPSDDAIIKQSGISPDEYRKIVLSNSAIVVNSIVPPV